jgi:hypothetical protein
MNFRSFVPMGLALCLCTGCQSYFPNGYGYSGPYSSFPAGTYNGSVAGPATGARQPAATSAGGSQFPTPVNKPASTTGSTAGGQSPKDPKLVPKYRDPGDTPTNLGAPASNDELDSIKRGTSSSRKNGNTPADESEDELGDSISSLDDEGFARPAPYKTVSAAVEDAEPRRLSAQSQSRPSPYKKDPEGYAWLRGVVVRDGKNGSWRITYSRDADDNDQYGGTLTLVDDDRLETLIDDDIIIVKGRVDKQQRDRFGKPSYRVEELQRLVPKTN